MEGPDRVTQLKTAIDHLETRQWRLAEVQCRILLAVDPADVEAMLILGLAIAASGEASRAAPVLERVRRARPEHAGPCHDLSTMQPRIPRALVARQYRACLRLSPNDARLRHDFAGYLLDNAEPEAALSVLRDAPDKAATHVLRGMALAETNRFKEAIRCFEHAIRLSPHSAAPWANLGMMLKIEGRFDEALTAYDRAIEQAPGDATIKINRAIALLHAGRWEDAWSDFRWRSDRPGPVPVSTAQPLPPLQAETRLDGRRVLVWHEEGFGDTLQFARYLAPLARRGAQVTAWVPVPLVRLLRGIPGIAVANAAEGLPPPHDLHCPFFHLPRVFGTTPRTVPGETYLTADPALTLAWGGRVKGEGLGVGLVWAGQARPWLQGFTSVDQRRSAGLAAFAPLAGVRGVRLVSLQAGTAAGQRHEAPAGMDLIDPMESVRDFADTAAIIANLDVVISVDTSVAHLAGAMGKPVFLLDRYDNCWRWLHGRTDSPWYPSMTIFRQQRPGDWSWVLHRAAASLNAMVLYRGGDTMTRVLADAA